MPDLFRIKSPDHFHSKICCRFKIRLRAEIIMSMNIPARDAENQDRNCLCCQADLSRVRASATADCLLKWNSEFLRKLFRVLDKHRIGNIALIHPADLDTAPHVPLGLGSTEIEII